MIEEAKKLLKQNKPEQAISVLSKYIEYEDPQSDEAYFVMGNAYRRMEELSQAMNCYLKASEINPNSPAKDAYEQTIEILEFYNKDLFNQ